MQQDIIKFNTKGYPIATNFLSQFTSWAKIWMSPISTNKSKTILLPRKRKNTSTSITRETDIRSRINYYEQPEPITLTQRISLYKSTCQKLRPTTNKTCSVKRLIHLGDILHVRNFWDRLEAMVYQDSFKKATTLYLPPSKRLPFNPDKPGSIYLPRKQKKSVVTYTSNSLPKKRPSFASSTIVYTSKNNTIQILPATILPFIEDDDDVPLGSLQFTKN
ncbi:hypothetical protein BD770DRAFT_397430 [Pilaira anomala]|nr:hypothetical protein BD770DRAFT_397430 [Pilaira anomala]